MDLDQQKAAAAKACLNYNPLINTVYVTGDCQCFANRNAAINHARGLTDKEIDVFIRSDNTAVIDNDQTDDITNESLTIPDPRLAAINAQPNAKVKPFAKNAKPTAVIDTTDVDPAATTATPAAPVDTAATTAAPVDAAATAAAPAAAPADNTGIISKLNEIVNEAEHLLGLDQQKAN